MFYNKIYLKKEVQFSKENSGYIFKGPLGNSLKIPLNNEVLVKKNNTFLIIASKNKAIFNLYLKIFRQKMIGTVYGFKRRLKLEGLGYIVTLEQNRLIFKLGFSHPVVIKIPNTIKVWIKKRKRLTFLGSDLNEITQFLLKIRQYKFPEIYKGKGILYFKEKINLKIGKKN